MFGYVKVDTFQRTKTGFNMSFYFNLASTKEISLPEVLGKLSDPAVTYRNDEEGIIIFYKPGASLRGAILYVQPDGYEIAVNAFTTRFDAILAREVAAAIASLLDCPVHPEDRETPISAAEAAEYRGDAWLDERGQESRFVLGDGTPDPIDAPTILFGYKHAFAVTKALVHLYEDQGMSTDVALDLIIEDAIALQDFDETEDVFVPQIMEIAPQATETKGLFRRIFSKSEQPSAPSTAFVLTEDVRTLTPVIATQGLIFAILGSETQPYRKVPIADVEDAARKAGAREFCVGAFDLTLSGQAYQTLYMQGTKM